MNLPNPLEQEKDEYVKDLHTLHKAETYLKRLFGEEAALDYLISECTKYAKEGKFSDHCYEDAAKELPELTEAEIAATLPQNWDGKPIFSYRDI